MKRTLFSLCFAIGVLSLFAQTLPEAITFTSSNNVGSEIAVRLRVTTESSPVEIDFGDGAIVTKLVSTNTSGDYITGSLGASKTVTIYAASGAIDLFQSMGYMIPNTGNSVASIDISNCPSLVSLSLEANNGFLKTIDLRYNPNLKYLSLKDNKLSSLDVSNNTQLVVLNVELNDISTLNLTNNLDLTTLICGNNDLEELDVTENTQLVTLDCKENVMLTSLKVSKLSNPNLTQLVCKLNSLTFSTLPDFTSLGSNYIYAYQNVINLPASYVMERIVDLSAEYNIRGNISTYVWYDSETENQLTEGVDYTIAGGVTSFLKEFPNGVFCGLENASFPDMSGSSKLYIRVTSITDSSTTGVENISAQDVKIISENNSIKTITPVAISVAIYTLDGRLVQTLQSNESSKTLSTGIYIVKYELGGQSTTAKVIVK